jgi:hypothetical protein
MDDEGQETVARLEIPEGGDDSVHVDPPSFETRIDAKPLPPSSPTATQVLDDGAHETAFTLGSGW